MKVALEGLLLSGMIEVLIAEPLAPLDPPRLEGHPPVLAQHELRQAVPITHPVDPGVLPRPNEITYIFPGYTGLRRELDTYLHYYNHDRVHHGHLTQGPIPADIVYGARKVEAR